MKYEAVVFDLDGVIIDSLSLMKLALNHCYEMFGWSEPAPFEEYFSHMGQRLETILELMGISTDIAVPYKEFCLHNEHRVKIVPGALELLKVLRCEGIPLAICTGKDRVRTVRLLKRFNIESIVQCVVTSDDVKNAKPSPECLYKVSTTLDIPPRSLLMVGDSVYDILCGMSAGAGTIGVTWGATSGEKLKTSNPDEVICTIGDLQRRLLTLCSPNNHPRQVGVSAVKSC